MFINYCAFLCSCYPLNLSPEEQTHSQLYSLSLGDMTYKYTSEENFTMIKDVLKFAISTFPRFSATVCLARSAVLVYNYIFLPCNLTSGKPIPFCSSACEKFRHLCESVYHDILRNAKRFLGIPFDDNCENLLYAHNRIFGFPNTSKDFEDHCYDESGT